MKSILCSRWLRFAGAMLLISTLCLGAAASSAPAAAQPTAVTVETLYSAEYCFSSADFHADTLSDFSGIFVTGVPEKSVATVCLGAREIQPGDVLTPASLDKLVLKPACAGSCDAVVTYQPIRATRLDPQAVVTIRIKNGKNEPPKAIGTDFETYKNIANDGQLSGTDPEDGPLTFQLVDSPKRGSIVLEESGAFVYTPNKNKVGEDSFTFTVTDDAGNVSQPACVKIRILKPSESRTFADLEGTGSQFEAMWTRTAGLYSGRSIAGTLCYGPEETVSRAEFLAMAMKLGKVPVEEELTVCGFSDAQDAAAWLQPYLASAMRRGIAVGTATEEGTVFCPNDPVTVQDAAEILQAIWQLPVSTSGAEDSQQIAAKALADAGILLNQEPEQPLTRMDAASLLYRISKAPM